jgi:hypothetical protein
MKGTCERGWREHEEFSRRKISVPLNPYSYYFPSSTISTFTLPLASISLTRSVMPQ